MKKVVKICSLIVMLTFILTNFVVAADPTDISKFTNIETSASKKAGTVLNSVLGVIQVIGVAVAATMLIVLGIKYMVSSVSDRAEIKKHAVIYVVGALLLFGASGIVQIIKSFSKNI